MSSRFYIKKLTTNELGYRKGKLSTGQMFYISKQAAEFFPTLSPHVNNDYAILEISVEYRRDPVFVNLVWHNDKLNREKGTRNEYRIYLNQDIAPDIYFFRPGDIILFERIGENVYYLKKIREGDHAYGHLNTLISKNKIRGAHALLNELEQDESS